MKFLNTSKKDNPDPPSSQKTIEATTAPALSDQPESQGENSPRLETIGDPGSTGGTAEGEHLDDIDLGDDIGAPPEEEIEHGPAMSAALDGDGFLTREAFWEAFQGLFTVLGGFTQLETLTGAPKLPTARGASDALYETARDTPALHWLIKPGSKWAQRILALGAFAVPVMAGCRAEIAARRAESANDDRDDGNWRNVEVDIPKEAAR